FILHNRRVTVTFGVLDLSILIPYGKPDMPDAYVCTSLELNSRYNQYIVKFKPVADMGAVHHMLLYGCTEPGLSMNKCGTAVICSEGQQRILYAWAKNAPSLILPEDVGFEIGGKSGIASLVLQLHFGDPHDMPTCGIWQTVTEQRQKKLAGVYLLATGGSVEPRATTFLESACIMKEEKTIYPFAFRTHSHSLGKVISGYRVRVDEFGECKWSLIGKKDPQLPQMFYPVEHYIPVKNGDILAARCTMESNRKRMTYIGYKATSNIYSDF
ncbi:Peptidylglycine alpha-hydroxylating monooxygenase, partial [Orchesella cincta]